MPRGIRELPLARPRSSSILKPGFAGPAVVGHDRSVDVGDPHPSGPHLPGVDLIRTGVTLVPRIVARTVDQVVFAVAALERLSCLGGRSDGTATDDSLAEVVPIAAARSRVRARPARPGESTGADADVPSADDLPIPSYDELAASQVVPRLAALSRAEQQTIRAYEASHRGRRTILGRLEQLSDSR